MKKLFIIMLALSFCLAGCGSNETNEAKSVFTTQQIQTTEAPTTETPTTEAPTTQTEIKKFDQTVSDSLMKIHYKIPDGIEKNVDEDTVFYYPEGGMVMISISDVDIDESISLDLYFDEFIRGLEAADMTITEKSIEKIDQYDAFHAEGTMEGNDGPVEFVNDSILFSGSMYTLLFAYYTNEYKGSILEIRNTIMTSMYFDEAEETTEAVTEAPKETTESEAPAGEPTLGEKNALQSAKSYLDYSAFSAKGLKEQLEFEGYSSDEAQYAVDHCGADWMEQAALSAKQYMDYSSFSRQALIEQLEFEGFTHEQAEHGAEAVGY